MLEQLLRARYPLVYAPTYEPDHIVDLITRAAAATLRPVRAWTVTRGIWDPLDPNDVTSTDHHPAEAMAELLKPIYSGFVIILIDMIDHLQEPTALRLVRDLVQSQADQNGQVVMIDHRQDLPAVLEYHAVQFKPSLPDEAAIDQMLRDVVKREHQRRSITARITRSAFQTIVRNLMGLTLRQAERVIMHAIAEDDSFSDEDVNQVLAQKRQLLHKDGLLDYVEAPVTLDDIAGMSRLKEWLARRQHSLSDAARDYGLQPPRGLLMLGIPGAGKSLCAKAVATAWGRPLLRLDPSVLYDRYIGESEQRLRSALEQAEAMSPIILWIDEIEKGFASSAAQASDGGLSQRMFGTMLTWMQEHTEPVFLIATANNIDALPPELLRKGRFDEIFFVDAPTREVRSAIFRIHLKRRGKVPAAFDLAKLAEASDGFTGAEIEQAVVAGLHTAFDDNARPPTTEDIYNAVKATSPLSVTMAEKLDKLRQWAANRCVPAD